MTLQAQREIPKLPPLPKHLPHEAVRLINEILLDTPDQFLRQCDAVLIFGSTFAENHRRIKNTLDSVYVSLKPKVIFIAGGLTKSELPPESEAILEVLGSENYPETEFRLDRTSMNTKENVLHSIELGLGEYKNIFFISKSTHCGRCKLTLAKHIPGASIRHRGYAPVVLEGQPLFENAEWWRIPIFVQLALGELYRIEGYGKRGDIEFPWRLQEKIAKIRYLIGS